MATYEVTEVKKNDEEIFQHLYEQSSLTFEGTTLDDENLGWLMNWFVENDFLPEGAHLTIFNIKGKTMNDYYELTGRNRYPAKLNIISIPLDQLENIGPLAIARFQLGGRWFDDVVDNNAAREGRND